MGTSDNQKIGGAFFVQSFKVFLSLPRMFRDSAAEAKSPKALVVTGLLIGLQLVLRSFAIQLAPSIRISLGFVMVGAAGMLYGPVVAALQAMAVDLLGVLLFPTGGAFFPGFTLSALVGGAINGLLLYRQKPTLWRAIAVRGANNLVVNVFLNTLWLSIMQGQGMIALLGPRMLKILIAMPFEVALFMLVLGALDVLKRQARL